MLKIYANTWGNYNEHGADGGEWITLPMDEDDLREELERIAEAMGDHDPEWFVNDYEWEGAIEWGEVSELDSYFKWNEELQELAALEEYEQEELAALIEAGGYSIAEAMEDQQRGNFVFYAGMSLDDVAAEIADEWLNSNTIPDFIRNYFNYDAFARDLRFDGYTETEWGTILID